MEQEDKIVNKITEADMKIYLQLKNISSFLKSHRNDFFKRIPELFLRQRFLMAYSHKPVEPLEIIQDMFEFLVNLSFQKLIIENYYKQYK